MAISRKVREQMMNSSWIRKMFEQGIELREIHGEQNVFDLSLGNPLLEPPPEFKTELQRLIDEEVPGTHRYMPQAGFPEVRAKVAEVLAEESGTAFTGSEILMTVGAAGGINTILRSILDEDDEVVLIAPFFGEYVFYVEHQTGVSKIATCDENWLPDIASLEATISPRTRAVIINSPNNPTGVIYPAELLDALNFSLRTLGFVNAPALMQRVVAGMQRASVDIDIYRKKRDLLYGSLTKIGYECVQPDGAFFVFPKSPIPNDTEFVAELQKELVLVVPGVGFGTPGFFRASYCVDDWVIEGSIDGFRDIFAQMNS